MTVAEVTRLSHALADVTVEELGGGRRRVTVVPRDPSVFVPFRSCETSYPAELVDVMLNHGAPAYLCAEIVREEDELYLPFGLRNYLLSYVGEAEFERTRVLDFGCGAGASTCVLARMFPTAEITAVGHVDDLLTIAESRVRLLGIPNVQFARSPDRGKLPDDLGTFDFIVLSGVYEHLLPEERAAVMPSLWRELRPGGVLFVNQTPNRVYPLEAHTTSLPLVNYLPASLAYPYVLRFSSHVGRNDTWETLLRTGIRGATRGEIVRSLRAEPNEAVLLRPALRGAADEADIWFNVSMTRNPRAVKRVVHVLFKLSRALPGGELVPVLHLAVRKGTV